MNFSNILNLYLKKKNMSLRALAIRADVSGSFLSRVSRGQKNISVELLEKLVKILEIEPALAETIRSQLLKKEVLKEYSVKTPLEGWDLAQKRDFTVLRQWYYVAIVNYTNTIYFDGRIENIAAALGLHLESARVAVQELTDKGFLEKDENGIIKKATKIRWSSHQSIDDIRHFHSQMLDRAKKELTEKTTEDDFNRRLIMGVMLTVPKSRVEEAKERLHNLIYELANDLIAEPGEEVYHLSAQFVPVTSPKKKI